MDINSARISYNHKTMPRKLKKRKIVDHKKYFKMRLSRGIEVLGKEVYDEYKDAKEAFWKNIRENDRVVIREVIKLMDELDFNKEPGDALNRLVTADGDQITFWINQLASWRDTLGDIANEYLTDSNFLYRHWKHKQASEFNAAKIEVSRQCARSGEKLYKEDIEGELSGRIWREQLMEIIITEFANYLYTKLESIELKINALKDRRKELARQWNQTDNSLQDYPRTPAYGAENDSDFDI